MDCLKRLTQNLQMHLPMMLNTATELVRAAVDSAWKVGRSGFRV